MSVGWTRTRYSNLNDNIPTGSATLTVQLQTRQREAEGSKSVFQGVTTADPAPGTEDLGWRVTAHSKTPIWLALQKIQPPQINAAFLGSAVRVELEERKIRLEKM